MNTKFTKKVIRKTANVSPDTVAGCFCNIKLDDMSQFRKQFKNGNIEYSCFKNNVYIKYRPKLRNIYFSFSASGILHNAVNTVPYKSSDYPQLKRIVESTFLGVIGKKLTLQNALLSRGDVNMDLHFRTDEAAQKFIDLNKKITCSKRTSKNTYYDTTSYSKNATHETDITYRKDKDTHLPSSVRETMCPTCRKEYRSIKEQRRKMLGPNLTVEKFLTSPEIWVKYFNAMNLKHLKSVQILSKKEYKKVESILKARFPHSYKEKFRKLLELNEKTSDDFKFKNEMARILQKHNICIYYFDGDESINLEAKIRYLISYIVEEKDTEPTSHIISLQPCFTYSQTFQLNTS